jgi:hypothetical protein
VGGTALPGSGLNHDGEGRIKSCNVGKPARGSGLIGMLLEFRWDVGGGGRMKSCIVGSKASGIVIPMSGRSAVSLGVIRSDVIVSADGYDVLAV